jgi:hypothetical protein
VVAGLASGLLGLASTAVSAWCLHPGWRSTEALVLVAAGGSLLVGAATGRPTVVRRALLADLATSMSLVALPPTLVAAVALPALSR